MPSFTLDTSVLGGLGFAYDEQTIEDRGRSIIVSWSNSGLDQDMELFGYSIRLFPAEPESKEVV